jgi:hypothetical protein
MLVDRGKFSYQLADSLPIRMAWFKAQMSLALETHRPERVAFRMHMGRAMTQEQIGVFHYPWGVLLLACEPFGVTVVELTGAALTAKRFGLPKGEKPMESIDGMLGSLPVDWDDAQRYAACVAWACLPKA